MSMIRKMDMAAINGKMEQSIKVNSKMTNSNFSFI